MRQGGESMKIVHIMANGEVRESIEGVVIQSEQFYQVLQGIIEKKENHNDRV